MLKTLYIVAAVTFLSLACDYKRVSRITQLLGKYFFNNLFICTILNSKKEKNTICNGIVNSNTNINYSNISKYYKY